MAASRQPEEPEADDDTEVAAARARRVERQAQWVDFQVRQAMQRGDFDDLPGAGKPIRGLGLTHDPEWWVKSLIEREQLTGVGPPALALRREDAELDDADRPGDDRAGRTRAGRGLQPTGRGGPASAARRPARDHRHPRPGRRGRRLALPARRASRAAAPAGSALHGSRRDTRRPRTAALVVAPAGGAEAALRVSQVHLRNPHFPGAITPGKCRVRRGSGRREATPSRMVGYQTSPSRQSQVSSPDRSSCAVDGST